MYAALHAPTTVRPTAYGLRTSGCSELFSPLPPQNTVRYHADHRQRAKREIRSSVRNLCGTTVIRFDSVAQRPQKAGVVGPDWGRRKALAWLRPCDGINRRTSGKIVERRTRSASADSSEGLHGASNKRFSENRPQLLLRLQPRRQSAAAAEDERSRRSSDPASPPQPCRCSRRASGAVIRTRQADDQPRTSNRKARDSATTAPPSSLGPYTEDLKRLTDSKHSSGTRRRNKSTTSSSNEMKLMTLVVTAATR
jgi:hypothetical protein